jgi:hypothetical protein
MMMMIIIIIIIIMLMLLRMMTTAMTATDLLLEGGLVEALLQSQAGRAHRLPGRFTKRKGSRGYDTITPPSWNNSTSMSQKSITAAGASRRHRILPFARYRCTPFVCATTSLAAMYPYSELLIFLSAAMDAHRLYLAPSHSSSLAAMARTFSSSVPIRRLHYFTPFVCGTES